MTRLSPITLSLTLHAVAALVLLTVKWDVVAVATPPSVAQYVTLRTPRPELPQIKPPMPALLQKAPAPRVFRPSLPVVLATTPLPRLIEQVPPTAVVAPPEMLVSPDPLPANMPPRPPPPIKLGNLTVVGVDAPPIRAAVILAGAFGAARPSERARVAPAIQASGFGDARVAKPVVVQAVIATAAMVPVEILSKPRPEYSDEARKLRLEGEVVLEVRFAASGQAQVLRMVRGLGHGLDESAERAALLIKFRPALQAGMPIDSTAVVHIIFQLAY